MGISWGYIGDILGISCGYIGDILGISLAHLSLGPLVHWSIGPLVECRMLNVIKVTLLSERTSGVPPVIFVFGAAADENNAANVKVSNTTL